MMQTGVVSGALRSQFSRRTEAEVFRRFQRQQQEDRKRRDREDNADNDTAELLDIVALIVTDAELRAFRLELDRYDAATIEALYQNEINLAEARAELERILGEAYVLPDGRRVFKTEDGLRVFDERGLELDATEIDPNEIEDWRPHWERFDGARQRVDALEAERQELLDYQEKLDAARERLDAGDLTREEFDRLRENLKADMPDAVRQRIPELASQEPESAPNTPAATRETAFVIDDDLVPASFAPPASGPGFGG